MKCIVWLKNGLIRNKHQYTFLRVAILYNCHHPLQLVRWATSEFWRIFLWRSPCRRRLRRQGRICIWQPLACDTQASCRHHRRLLRNLLEKRMVQIVGLYLRQKTSKCISYSLMPNTTDVCFVWYMWFIKLLYGSSVPVYIGLATQYTLYSVGVSLGPISTSREQVGQSLSVDH